MQVLGRQRTHLSELDVLKRSPRHSKRDIDDRESEKTGVPIEQQQTQARKRRQARTLGRRYLVQQELPAGQNN